VAERNGLLTESVGESPTSRRYAVRRLPSGRLEFYEAKLTEMQGDVAIFHGHPTVRVPAWVLRQFRNAGQITPAEYNRWLKALG
jgi:hypothetical protein